MAAHAILRTPKPGGNGWFPFTRRGVHAIRREPPRPAWECSKYGTVAQDSKKREASSENLWASFGSESLPST